MRPIPAKGLRAARSSVAVRMYRPRQLDLVTTHLDEIARGLFGATRYLDRRGRPTGREDLLSHDFVGYDATPAILEGFREAGTPLARDWFATRCDDNAVDWELVRAGCGLGFAQVSVGRACREVEEIPTDLALPSLPVRLTTHEAMRDTPRIRRVWDMLAEGLTPVLA